MTEPPVKKEFAVEEVLIEGCVNDKAKNVIQQMLEKRLAELDPQGLQAKFIIKLQNELNIMPSCGDLLEGKKEEPK